MLIFSCKNDQEDFGQMKGINYFSRNDAISFQQISFENTTGISNDTLLKKGLLTIAPNTFANEDGSAFSGKVIFSIREDYVRGFMALNSIPTIDSDGLPLNSEGSIYTNAVDIQGHKLKIASGKNIDIAMPGGTNANQNKFYYAEDNVSDPSPANTSLFSWKESSSDSVTYYFDNAAAKFYYKLNPTQLGWISCARSVSNSNPVGINVRVWGVHNLTSGNTAVYVVPVNGKSAIRLWNYDKATNLFSLNQPCLTNGTDVYIIVIASTPHFKIYYAKELYTVGSSSQKTVTAVEKTLNSIASNLYYL